MPCSLAPSCFLRSNVTTAQHTSACAPWLRQCPVQIVSHNPQEPGALLAHHSEPVCLWDSAPGRCLAAPARNHVGLEVLLEMLPDIERAHVHLDWETDHKAEHQGHEGGLCAFFVLAQAPLCISSRSRSTQRTRSASPPSCSAAEFSREALPRTHTGYWHRSSVVLFSKLCHPAAWQVLADHAEGQQHVAHQTKPQRGRAGDDSSCPPAHAHLRTCSCAPAHAHCTVRPLHVLHVTRGAEFRA